MSRTDMVAGLTAEEWAGMYDIAVNRAEQAEMEVSRLKIALAQADAVCEQLQQITDKAREVFRQIDKRTRTVGLDMSNYHAINIQVMSGREGKDYWQAVWAYNKALADFVGGATTDAVKPEFRWEGTD